MKGDIAEAKLFNPDFIIANMPVSYTHLDVYKRQEVYLHAGCLNGCYLYDQRVIGIINDEIHTRKDVYKRQLKWFHVRHAAGNMVYCWKIS